MKALKIIGIALLVIVVLFVGIAFLISPEVNVERSIVINAPVELIFEQVNTLKNWEKWSPWHQIDPMMKLTYEGPESGAGAKYYWSSDDSNVGSGSLTIVESRPNTYIKTEMDFMEQGVGTASYRFEHSEDGVKLTWGMNSNMGNNPIMRYLGLFMDGLVGPDFEKGLNSIKMVVENMEYEEATEDSEENSENEN